MTNLFLKLIFAHAITDMALQHDYIGKMKSPNYRRNREEPPWYSVMTAHALINGAGVYIVTGIVGLGIAETIMHFIIDFGACKGDYSHLIDQVLHLGSKALWVLGYIIIGGVL